MAASYIFHPLLSKQTAACQSAALLALALHAQGPHPFTLPNHWAGRAILISRQVWAGSHATCGSLCGMSPAQHARRWSRCCPTAWLAAVPRERWRRSWASEGSCWTSARYDSPAPRRGAARLPTVPAQLPGGASSQALLTGAPASRTPPTAWRWRGGPWRPATLLYSRGNSHLTAHLIPPPPPPHATHTSGIPTPPAPPVPGHDQRSGAERDPCVLRASGGVRPQGVRPSAAAGAAGAEHAQARAGVHYAGECVCVVGVWGCPRCYDGCLTIAGGTEMALQPPAMPPQRA
jgi:hypothetical protein